VPAADSGPHDVRHCFTGQWIPEANARSDCRHGRWLILVEADSPMISLLSAEQKMLSVFFFAACHVWRMVIADYQTCAEACAVTSGSDPDSMKFYPHLHVGTENGRMLYATRHPPRGAHQKHW
jgi:hypothetical protein